MNTFISLQQETGNFAQHFLFTSRHYYEAVRSHTVIVGKLDSFLCVHSLQGHPGSIGPEGRRGPSGNQGYRGVQGPKGDVGDDGAVGPRGQKGDQVSWHCMMSDSRG